MAENPTQRRLAAILAPDVVGYSRIMEQDKAGTLALLKARRRAVLEPLVVQHQGRVFKSTGDGVLVEFRSAVNAVQCAVDLQERMAAANSEQPVESPIVLRIGVNLGDVTPSASRTLPGAPFSPPKRPRAGCSMRSRAAADVRSGVVQTHDK